MKKFNDWLGQNLTVGPYPYKQNQWFQAKKYDIIINVSDEFYDIVESQQRECGLKTFWFPMNEAMRDVGLNSIYGAMVILFNAERNNKRVYLHCHAGLNRSPTIKAAYHYLRTGAHLKEERDNFMNRLCAACSRGYLPPLAETERFLSSLGKQLESMKGEPMGGLLDHIKLETIRNF